jgi:hypothetical protein
VYRVSSPRNGLPAAPPDNSSGGALLFPTSSPIGSFFVVQLLPR